MDSQINRRIFEVYIQRHPELSVIAGQQLAVPSGGGGGEVGLIMAYAGGTAPDVIPEINNRSIQQYASQGFLYPLDTIPGFKPQEHVPSKQLKVLTYKGHIYGYVRSYSPVTIFYRRDYFKAAGLESANGDCLPPATWDDLVEYSKRLTLPDEGRWGLAMKSGLWAGWMWIPHVWQAGGQIIAQDELGNWRAVFDSDAGLAALKLYQRLRWTRWTWKGRAQTGFSLINPESCAGDDLLRGRAAMEFCAPSCVTTVAYAPIDLLPIIDKLGVAPPLTGPGQDGVKVNFLSTRIVGINGTLKDPDKIRAAWDYVQWLCGDEAKRIETEMLVQAGYGKTVHPDYLEKFGYGSLVADIPASTRKALREIIEYGQPDPYCPNFMMVQGKGMEGFINRVLNDPDADPERELKAAVQEINAKILTPEVRKLSPAANAARRLMGALLLGAAAWLLWRFWAAVRSTYGASAASRRAGDGRQMGRAGVLAWIFMLPALLSLLVWAYLPMLRGLGMAFQDYRVIGESSFVGLDNFATALSQADFWMTLLRTFYYVLLTLGIGFALPIILALMLSEIRLGQYLFRTVYYLPTMTSGLVVMFVWKHLIFPPTDTGLLNQLLIAAGLEPQRWLQSEGWSMLCVVVPMIWAGVGASSLIYLAALKTVEDALYEAAAMDGASTWQKLRHITLPSLKGLILINFVGAFIGAFHAMQNVFVMTEGGPNRATHVMGLEIFYNFVVWLKMGYATAIAWILGFMLIGFTVYQLRLLGRVEFRTTGKGGH